VRVVKEGLDGAGRGVWGWGNGEVGEVGEKTTGGRGGGGGAGGERGREGPPPPPPRSAIVFEKQK